MNENPTTRIVAQKTTDVVYLNHPSRPPSRMSSIRAPLSSATSLRSSSIWDSRSIATQTSDEEAASENKPQKRQPRWKRTARQRKSIAVMETNKETMELTNRFRSSSYSTGALTNHNSALRGCNSVDNFLEGRQSKDEKQFLQKFQQLGRDEEVRRSSRRLSMGSLNSSPTENNVILSKTVRKEKRKQREKRERSMDRLSTSSSLSCYRTLGHYQHLTVKTPMHICGDNAPIPAMDEGMQHCRAEPFFGGSTDSLNNEGRKMAIETFQLLGLLLPPEDRRKLQLLLKFMKRVRGKQGLRLSYHPRKSNHDVILETFAEAILRPKFDLANYDEELCRKIVCFFMEHFDDIWTPPVCLRKEVEERVISLSHTSVLFSNQQRQKFKIESRSSPLLWGRENLDLRKYNNDCVQSEKFFVLKMPHFFIADTSTKKVR